MDDAGTRPDPIGATPFLSWLQPRLIRREGASLEALSGEKVRAPANLRSYVTTTVEAAWALPLTALTCEHARLLTSQRRGLPWLARGVAEFVARYPLAEITFYAGDLTTAALQAYPDIALADPGAAAVLRGLDYTGVLERFAWDRSLLRETRGLIAAMRGVT